MKTVEKLIEEFIEQSSYSYEGKGWGKYCLELCVEGEDDWKSSLKDIREHGCVSGCSPFIYCHHAREVFNKFEDGIEHVYSEFLDRCGEDYGYILTEKADSILQLQNNIVWFTTEILCSGFLDWLDEENSEEDKRSV